MIIIFFCCVNERPASAVRECCKKNSLILRNHMKKRISELGLKRVRVNQSGCLDRCELGPIMVVYPEGFGIALKILKIYR